MKKSFVLSKYESNPAYARRDIYQYYLNKYFNIYMTKYKWIGEGITKEADDYIKRHFWSRGTIATFVLKGSKGLPDTPNGQLIFCDYAPNMFNIYDFPIYASLINKRGVDFIPSRMMKVDEEVVLGFAQRNKKSVFEMVDFYLTKITDIEMILRTNLKSYKTPVVFAFDNETEQKIRQIKNNFDSDDPSMMIDVDDVNKINALNLNSNYVADKLYSYKIALENELKEYLGVNNLGVYEKKEHLINSEVESNEEIVANSGDCFVEQMKDFCEKVKEVFGIKLDFIVNKPDIMKEEEEQVGEDEENA